MFDLATDPDSQELIKQFWDAGKIVSAVCHGPAALANVKLNDGTYLIADKAVTGFSSAEEDAFGTSKYMPFVLESALIANGGKYTKGDNWAEHVVQDGKLLTGQNPASAGALGDAVLAAL